MKNEMRVIKFRAWNNDFKKMEFSDSDLYGFFAMNSDNDENKPLMQFTGLLDKNGQEVYEGDIIEDDDYGLYEVIWDNETAEYTTTCLNWINDRAPKSTGVDYMLDSMKMMQNLFDEWASSDDELRRRNDCAKVVGNKYETPDFLK